MDKHINNLIENLDFIKSEKTEGRINTWEAIRQKENAINSFKKQVENLIISGVIVPKVCELTEWDGKDETNLCDCGKGDGTCKKQTAL